ncbi:hypothetical protein FHG87_013154 [Trinorchestia longiramus]|nr:hypothetical protein FHG87_013154 [Trinorchestia longiramus]
MGVGVMQTKNEVFLEQSAQTKALLCRFGMDKANSVATPVDVNADLVTTSDEVEECDKYLYQSAVENQTQQPPLSSGLRPMFCIGSLLHVERPWVRTRPWTRAVSRTPRRALNPLSTQFPAHEVAHQPPGIIAWSSPSPLLLEC